MVLLCNNIRQWQVTCTNWLWLSNTFLYSVLETWKRQKSCMKDKKLHYNTAFYLFFFLVHWLEVWYIVLSPRCKQLQQGPLVRMTHLWQQSFKTKWILLHQLEIILVVISNNLLLLSKWRNLIVIIGSASQRKGEL